MTDHEPPAASLVLGLADDLPDLHRDFPHFRIWRESTCGRVRYIARSLHPGMNPHTVVTDDPAELRAALEPAQAQAPSPADPAPAGSPYGRASLIPQSAAQP